MTKKNSEHTYSDLEKSKLSKLFENLLKVTYEYIKGKKYQPQNKNSLIERLKIHPDHLAIFDQVLKELKEKGKVNEKEDKFHPTENIESQSKPDGKIIIGSLKVHPRGFGFVEVQDSEEQDIFIPRQHINSAVDGDIVEVLVNLETVSEKGPEGKVLTIINRKRKNIVGTVLSVKGNKALVFCPILGDRNPAELTLSHKKTQEKLKEGDRVLLEVEKWGSKTEKTQTQFLRTIGNIDDPSCDIEVAILENEIRHEFPQEAILEARSYGNRVTKKDLQGRLDLRDLECFTVDPDTAKDFDDAVSLVMDGDHYILGVHIADVSHYVKRHGALDREARLRCNSTYFPRYCVPMLPHELSDNLCSLREGVIRLTVSVFIRLDKTGNLIDWKIDRSFIRSHKRFTYKQAKSILDGKLQSKHKKTLVEMVHVCNLLKNKRAERGSVQLYMPELIVHVDDKGVPCGTEIVEYDISHQMIEEFMLKANEVVAMHLAKQGKNLTYRVHEVPAKESLREFSALALAFGYTLSPDPTPQEIQRFFVDIVGSPYEQYLATCYIRSMRLACYSPDNIGHYGLSLEHYCHFTSPIRRYVDLVVHGLLFGDSDDKKELTRISQDASERERISAKAEGSVVVLKKLRLLQMMQNANPDKQYEAVITRIKPFGVYFDIIELMLEGFLHVSELQNDYFVYNEEKMHLKGRWTNISYKAGDTLVVMVQSIDLISQEAKWNFVAHIQQEKPSITPYEGSDRSIAQASSPRKKARRKETPFRKFGQKHHAKASNRKKSKRK